LHELVARTSCTREWSVYAQGRLLHFSARRFSMVLAALPVPVRLPVCSIADERVWSCSLWLWCRVRRRCSGSSAYGCNQTTCEISPGSYVPCVSPSPTRIDGASSRATDAFALETAGAAQRRARSRIATPTCFGKIVRHLPVQPISYARTQNLASGAMCNTTRPRSQMVPRAAPTPEHRAFLGAR
jgi:hypothetical protein